MYCSVRDELVELQTEMKYKREAGLCKTSSGAAAEGSTFEDAGNVIECSDACTKDDSCGAFSFMEAASGEKSCFL